MTQDNPYGLYTPKLYAPTLEEMKYGVRKRRSGYNDEGSGSLAYNDGNNRKQNVQPAVRAPPKKIQQRDIPQQRTQQPQQDVKKEGFFARAKQMFKGPADDEVQNVKVSVRENGPSALIPEKKSANKQVSSVLSKEAIKIVSGDKRPIIGWSKCPHCKKQDAILKGKFEAKVIKDGQYSYVMQDYEQAMKTSQKTLADLEKLYSEKKVKKENYEAAKAEIQHVINTNAVILDKRLDYANALNKYKIYYVDDLPPQYNVKDVDNDYKKAHDKKISLESVYKKYRDMPDGDKVVQYIALKEIADVYDIMSFPTPLKDSCEIDRAKVKSGKTDGIMKNCKAGGGALNPVEIIAFDADQSNDVDRYNLVKHLSRERVQKEMAQPKNLPKKKIKSIDAVLSDM